MLREYFTVYTATNIVNIQIVWM